MAITKISSVSYYTNEYTEDVSLYDAFGFDYPDTPTLETIVAWANGDYSLIAEIAGVELRSRPFVVATPVVDPSNLQAPVRERPMGWDVGVATPKDISILWALLADGDMIDQVWKMHAESVGIAAEYLRRHATVARVMHDGVSSVTPVDPLMVGIQHSLNRKLEPHLHSHLLVFRDGYDTESQKLRSLHSPYMYRHYQVALALHRASMRYRIAEAFPNLRYERNVRGEIVIANMPTTVRQRFLGRRCDIEQWATDHALAPQLLEELRSQQPALYHQIMQRAALETRNHKPEPSFTGNILREHWHRVIGRARGRALEEIFTTDLARIDPLEDKATLFEQVSSRLLTRSSTWTREDVLIAIAESATYGIASLDQAEALADDYLGLNTTVPLLLAYDGNPVTDEVRSVIPDELLDAVDVDSTLSRLRNRYTSTSIVEKEQAFVAWASTSKSLQTSVAFDKVLQGIHRYPTLSWEQETAIKTITTSTASVPIVRGGPGSGKTYMLRVATEIWENAGIDVIGVAFTGRASAELLGSIPNAMTIDRFLLSEKPTRPYVVICDEASQVSTELLARLQAAIAPSHGKLVLVGDHRQLPSVQAGGVFTHLWQRRSKMSLSCAEMRGNQRQQSEYMQEVVECLESNRVQKALGLLQEHDGVIAYEDEDLVLRKMAIDYYNASLEGDKVMMLALRNEDVTRLNANVRALMVSARYAGKASPLGAILIPELPASRLQPFVGQREYRENEQIMLLQNDTVRVGHDRYCVRKGFTGTVLDKTENGVHVRLDRDGSIVELPMHYIQEHTDYAYARTIYRSQGETIGSRDTHGTVMLYRPDTLTPEDAWVAATRATHDLKMYIALSVRKREGWAPYETSFTPLGVPKLKDATVLDFDEEDESAEPTQTGAAGGLAETTPPLVDAEVAYETLYEDAESALKRVAKVWDMDRSLNNADRAIDRLSVMETQARIADAIELSAVLNVDELLARQSVYADLRTFSLLDHDTSIDPALAEQWGSIANTLATLIADPVAIDPDHEYSRLNLLAFVLSTSEVDDDKLTPLLATLTDALQSVDDDKQTERNRMVLRLARLVRQEPEQASVVLDYLRSALVSELANTFASTPDLALQVLEHQAVINLALEIAPQLTDANPDLVSRVFGGDNKLLVAFSRANDRYHEREAAEALAAEANASITDHTDNDVDVADDFTPPNDLTTKWIATRPQLIPIEKAAVPEARPSLDNPAAQTTHEKVSAPKRQPSPYDPGAHMTAEEGLRVLEEATAFAAFLATTMPPDNSEFDITIEQLEHPAYHRKLSPSDPRYQEIQAELARERMQEEQYANDPSDDEHLTIDDFLPRFDTKSTPTPSTSVTTPSPVAEPPSTSVTTPSPVAEPAPTPKPTPTPEPAEVVDVDNTEEVDPGNRWGGLSL
jgi:conjugative relaxase-like TrwC/TraI family protein